MIPLILAAAIVQCCGMHCLKCSSSQIINTGKSLTHPHWGVKPAFLPQIECWTSIIINTRPDFQGKL